MIFLNWNLYPLGKSRLWSLRLTWTGPDRGIFGASVLNVEFVRLTSLHNSKPVIFDKVLPVQNDICILSSARIFCSFSWWPCTRKNEVL